MIHPHSKEGHKFIIIATKYTIKWVEAIPMKSITQEKVIAFLTKNIITQIGVPQWLIMDNGQNFKGRICKHFVKSFILHKPFLLFIILKVMVKLKPQIG